jgi:hypothetical protein
MDERMAVFFSALKPSPKKRQRSDALSDGKQSGDSLKNRQL